ncbi:MAG: hypothetical protein JXA54_04345 [Candidatus Heimdallarchaeota archaeon]|nr:hypothetical protein [Candidatus Heimdallarchaeota archaeon]
MSDKDYQSTYQSLLFYSIGGLWGYAIMRLIDSNKEEKVRLAKCKKTENFPSTEKYTWAEIPVEHVTNLSQVQKINFKPTDNFQLLAEKVIDELTKVKVTDKSVKKSTKEETEES